MARRTKRQTEARHNGKDRTGANHSHGVSGVMPPPAHRTVASAVPVITSRLGYVSGAASGPGEREVKQWNTA